MSNDKGVIIKIDRSKDKNLTDFGRATLSDRYLGQNESSLGIAFSQGGLPIMTSNPGSFLKKTSGKAIGKFKETSRRGYKV